MIGSTFQRLRRLVARLRSDQRGNVVMIFAFAMPALVIVTLGGVDLHRVTTIKGRLQDALDAATLAAARSSYTSEADLTRVGLNALRANYPGIDSMSYTAKFVLTKDQVVVADSTAQVKTLIANVVLPPYGKILDDTLPVSSHSEVNRSSKNIEVALVLDITGSMSGSKITSLKNAANELVDIVVQDLQSPYYSKMSIVPYSMGVNLGSYANGARGAPTGYTSISNISWYKGSALTVSSVTRSSTATVTTTANHGLTAGDKIAFWNVSGMGNLNGTVYTVGTVTSNKSFILRNGANTANADTRNWSSLNISASTPYVAECARTDCKPTVTSNNHGLPQSGGTVYLTNVGGMTDLNDTGFTITYVNANTYLLDTVGGQTYTSGGRSYCGQNGCEWRVFTSAAGSLRSLANSACVSERTGGQAYTDAYAAVGFNYPADAANRGENPCPSSALLPLSSSKTSLKTLINGLSIGGSTAGQIGAAWGWYTVSPSYASLWGASAPAAYDQSKVIKAVILMTDGEFNTPYAAGVIAANAGTGSGAAADHINQNATNGNPFDQTEKLCDGMKAKGILVYTVGFQVADEGDAAQLMQDCATSPAFAYLPASGADLTEAFKAIGRDITRLRISR